MENKIKTNIKEKITKKEQYPSCNLIYFIYVIYNSFTCLHLVQFVHLLTDVPVTDRYGAGAKYIFPDPSLPVAAFKDEMSS